MTAVVSFQQIRSHFLCVAIDTPQPAAKPALVFKEVKLVENSDPARARAEAAFKKETRRREGEQAMAEHLAKEQAMRAKTARLRELRLARDAAAKEAPPHKRGD
jgi:hypothetical protein